MYKVKICYESGYADIGECATEAEARKVVSMATLRMMTGQDGISDVAAWEVAR